MKSLDQLSELERVRDMHLDTGSHHYITLSFLYRWIEEKLPGFVRGTLLDYGCGGQPYRAFLTPHVDKYLGADVAATEGIKLDVVIRPGEPLALADASIDTVLSNQVLEHVPDPVAYLKEAQRVLRPGGGLVLSAPMQWRHHEAPFDYRRFTRYGVEEILERTGFELVSIDPTGGVFALIGQILASYLADVRGIFRPRLYRFLNWVFLGLDRRYPDADETICWLVLARKPEATGASEASFEPGPKG